MDSCICQDGKIWNKSIRPEDSVKFNWIEDADQTDNFFFYAKKLYAGKYLFIK